MNVPEADVLIVGGGLAAQRCCETLRRLGHDGSIAMLCAEPSRPYDRPPLSKSVLLGSPGTRELEYRPDSWYAQRDVRLILGAAAVKLDPGSRRVSFEQDGRPAESLTYSSLVIATGARARRLPGLEPGGRVHELRTRADANALRDAFATGEGRLIVVGAGLVGMEVASAARALGLEVTLVEAAATPLERALPPGLGLWMAGIHRAHGVDVRLGRKVAHAERCSDEVRLLLDDGEAIAAGTVLVAAGTAPAVDWLAGSGLGPGPIETDAAGRTAIAGIFAAGDVASFPDPFLDARLPSQHWEAAARQGSVVAHGILGTSAPAPVPAMFWSDQHGRRIQMVGHAPQLCSIELERGTSPHEPFAAWITGPRGPAAAMLVDRPDLLPAARRWIAGTGSPANADPAPHQGVETCPT